MQRVNHTTFTPHFGGETAVDQTSRPSLMKELPFALALADVRARARAYEKLATAHTDLEEEVEAFGKTLPDNLPLPACLTVAPTRMTLIIDGEERPIDAQPYTYKSADVIIHADLAAERKVEMIAALEAWQADQAAADEASGWTAKQTELAKADKAWQSAHNDLYVALHKLMRAPTADPREIKIKLSLIRKYDDYEGDDARWLRSVVNGALAASVGDFDVGAWIEAFESIPGHYVDGRGPTYIEPEAWPDGDFAKGPTGHALWASLSPAQKAAVQAEGSRRRPLVPPGTDFSAMAFTPVPRGTGPEILHAAE